MSSAQFSAQQVLKIIKRRRRFIILPVVIVTSCCVIGAFVLPRKYESSTTILVQRDEILNPLVSFTMAVSMASEDRLKTFNEIVFSQTTVQTLIDSLHLARHEHIVTEKDRQELIKKVQMNIQTGRPGSSSFMISYLDEVPHRAQKAVVLLSGIFIRTTLQVENQRNELAVQFFESKLEELRLKFQHSQQEMVSILRQRIHDLPVENRVLPGRIDEADQDVHTIDRQLKAYQRGMALVEKFPGAFRSEEGKGILFELQRLDLPYAGEMRPLILKYDEFTRRYTSRYPEVQKLEKQIGDLLVVMRTSLEAEIARERTRRAEVERRRGELVEDLKRASVSRKVDEDQESSYDIYRKLYDEMKVKLEQARTSRDLGRNARDQFIIIDPPLVPTEPAKPNRLLIILGGLGLGIIIGFLTAGTAELLDSTVRSKSDVGVYQKPVIAFIPDGHILTRS